MPAEDAAAEGERAYRHPQRGPRAAQAIDREQHQRKPCNGVKNRHMRDPLQHRLGQPEGQPGEGRRHARAGERIDVRVHEARRHDKGGDNERCPRADDPRKEKMYRIERRVLWIRKHRHATELVTRPDRDRRQKDRQVILVEIRLRQEAALDDRSGVQPSEQKGEPGDDERRVAGGYWCDE